MTHSPTFLDISADLKRAIYASLSKDGFKDREGEHFLNIAVRNFNKLLLERSPNCKEVDIAKKRLFIENTSDHNRRENLLTASYMLQCIN